MEKFVDARVPFDASLQIWQTTLNRNDPTGYQGRSNTGIGNAAKENPRDRSPFECYRGATGPTPGQVEIVHDYPLPVQVEFVDGLGIVVVALTCSVWRPGTQ